MSFDFGTLWREITQLSDLEKRWAETTALVLVKTPSLANRREKRITVRQLGNVKAGEIHFPGPRGGKGTTRRHFDGSAGGWDWKDCDVRVADEAMKAKLAELDARQKALDEERRVYLHERFLELKPLSWDDVVHARDAWKDFNAVYQRVRDGKASSDELKPALEALLGRSS